MRVFTLLTLCRSIVFFLGRFQTWFDLTAALRDTSTKFTSLVLHIPLYVVSDPSKCTIIRKLNFWVNDNPEKISNSIIISHTEASRNPRLPLKYFNFCLRNSSVKSERNEVGVDPNSFEVCLVHHSVITEKTWNPS